MPLDLENSYSSIKEKIAALKSTKEAIENYNKSVDQTAKSFEPASKDVTSPLQDFKKNAKRYQKNVKTQFDELFDIQKTLSDNAQSFCRAVVVRGPDNSGLLSANLRGSMANP